MRNRYRHPPALVRLVLVTLAALVIAAPASAQFGGLRKKIKPTPAQPANSPQSDPPGGGGMVVLTDGVVQQLLAGLKAGQVERAAAAKEDTPFGRYKKAEAAYAEAKPKCEAAQQTFYERAANNQKMLDKYTALTEKMVAAQSKQDYKLMTIYQDSAMAMQDPSCVVKNPEQPKDFYEAQRQSDVKAEKKEVEASGLSAGELAMVKERTIAILRNTEAPGGASASEKAAVSASSAELKPLLGLVEQPVVQAAKPDPAPAPATPTPQVDPQMSAAASSMGACMTRNMQTHQAQIQALSERAQAAQAANDTGKLLAIADTVQKMQMAGCMGR